MKGMVSRPGRARASRVVVLTAPGRPRPDGDDGKGSMARGHPHRRVGAPRARWGQEPDPAPFLPGWPSLRGAEGRILTRSRTGAPRGRAEAADLPLCAPRAHGHLDGGQSPPPGLGRRTAESGRGEPVLQLHHPGAGAPMPASAQAAGRGPPGTAWDTPRSWDGLSRWARSPSELRAGGSPGGCRPSEPPRPAPAPGTASGSSPIHGRPAVRIANRRHHPGRLVEASGSLDADGPACGPACRSTETRSTLAGRRWRRGLAWVPLTLDSPGVDGGLVPNRAGTATSHVGRGTD